MPCYRPLQAWRGKRREGGKRSIVFKRSERAQELVDPELKLPCGQCIGCRLERSRQWAIRCVHEAQMYSENCFVTLTYDDSHLPPGGSLVLRDYQCFMKRLRKFAGRPGIRFFHCGEYGEKLGRPHYHACIFNFDFSDKVLWSVRNGNRLYRSASLEKLWPFGFASIGDVSFESAAYVARYVMKKITGEAAAEHYVRVGTGEIISPEYVTMSRRPGIGKMWFEKFKTDIYPDDFTVVRGVRMRPPKFYDSQFELTDPQIFCRLKARRLSRAVRLADDNDSFRLPVKEEVKLSRLKLLSRPLEVGHDS